MNLGDSLHAIARLNFYDLVIQHKPSRTSNFTIMKCQVISMLVGAIALTAGVGAIALSATHNPVMAQGSSLSQQPVMSPTATPRPIPPLPGLEGIELTAQQQEQIKQIAQQMQAQFESIVPRPPELTAQQQEKIRQVMEAERQKIEAVLTQEQLEQLRQDRNNPNSKPAPAFGPMPAPPPNLAKLNLTQEQQEQLEQIHQEMASQIREALPAPPQLTDEQKAKLDTLMQSYRDRIEAVLTSDQQQQFRQNLQKIEQFHQNQTGSQTREG